MKPYELKKKLVLDQEKSKISLAQIYEQEYLKQKDAVDPANKFKDEEKPKEHKEIRVYKYKMLDVLQGLIMGMLNVQRLRFIEERKPIKLIGNFENIPPVLNELVLDFAVSDAVLLAAEEIQAKQRGELKSAPERTSTDKKRSRRKKKLKQRALGSEKHLKKRS